MTDRVASALRHALYTWLLFFLVNCHAHIEDPFVISWSPAKRFADHGEQAQLPLSGIPSKSPVEEKPYQNEGPVRVKRQMHDSMTVTASRDSGIHWGGDRGGSGNRDKSGSKNSNPSNGVVDFQKAQAILAQANSLCVLGDQLTPGKPPAPVFSVAGVGSLPLTGTVGESLISGVTAAIGRLTALGKNLVGTSPMGVLVGSIGYVPSVGEGSDKVPGRTPENFISVSVPARVMDLPDKETLRRAAKEAGVVNLPVRGELVTEKDVDIRVVRTPVAKPVKVVEAVRDEKTGLYNTGIPNSAVPGGRLVTTPPTVPNVQGQRPLVNPIANPPVTVHTGNVGGLRSTLVKPFPASEASEERDIVLVYPDNAGLEPVYVMYNKPRKGVPEAGHDYIPAPRTEEITGFPGLIPQRRKTPKQGGGGLRERWKDPKGRTIYEWDSRHGDLEAYRASDGTHLGSFDHKTGVQRDRPLSKRKLQRLRRDLRQIKSLKLRLEWFDKSTDALVGGEYSRDLRDDGTVIEQLGLSIANNVNNGGYDVLPGWVGILQPYFKHGINLNSYDYQVAFDYREWWEDMRVISFNLYESPNWRNEGGRLIINLTPNVSGEIVRAVYHHHGLDFSRSMMRVHLLGTSFDCDLGTFRDIEFFPKEKRLNSGQAFEVSHTERATRTNHGRLSFTKPLQVVLTFTVRVKV